MRAPRPRRRPRVRRRAHRGLRRRLPSALAARAVGRLVAESGIARERCAQLADAAGGHAHDHRLLGDGADAARARDREHPGDRQPPAAARQRSGRPGAGLCPVRGHSNVQGDRTMGIDHRPGAALPRRARRAGSASRRRARTAWTSWARSRRCSAGRVRLLFALGGNFLSAAPDTDAHRRARCAAAR